MTIIILCMMETNKNWVKTKYRKKNIVERYNKTRFTHFQGKLNHRMEIIYINEALKRYGIKSVIEIAPGTGRIGKELEVEKYVGVDSSEAMLDELKGERREEYAFIQGDAFKLPFPESCVDDVICFRLIRHFELNDRKELYEGIRKILKKDGFLIMDALNKERGVLGKVHDILLKVAFGVVRRDERIYDKYYTKDELIDEVEANGFRVVEMYSVNPHYALYSPITRLKFCPKFLERGLLKKAVENNSKEKNRKSKKCYSWVVVAKKIR